MTPLRAKYQRDLTVRGLAPRTVQSYTSFVADLARHFRRSPDRISYDEVLFRARCAPDQKLSSVVWMALDSDLPAVGCLAALYSATRTVP